MIRTTAIMVFAIALGRFSEGMAQAPIGDDTARGVCLENPSRACVLDEALEVAQSIGNGPARAGELGLIAGAQARAGNIDKARRVLQTIKEGYYESRMFTIISIAKAQSRSGLMKDAEATFREAIQLAELSTDPLKHGELLGPLAIAEAAAGLSSEAAATFDRTLVLAQSVSIEPAARASKPPYPEQRLSYLLRALAENRAQAGETAMALQIANSIKYNLSQRKDALVTIAVAQTKAGATKDAVATLDLALQAARARRHEKWPSFRDRENEMPTISTGLGYLMDACQIAIAQAKAGGREQAAATLKEALEVVPSIKAVSDDWDVSHALSYVAAALQEVGLEKEAATTRDQALRVARQINPLVDSQHVGALVGVAETQARAGLGSEAAGTFDEALQVAGAIGSELGREGALRRIAVAEANVGMMRESRDSFDKAVRTAVTDYPLHTNLLLGLALNQLQAGFTKEARTTFDQYLDAAGPNSDGPMRYATLFTGIARPGAGRLVAESDVKGRRQVLQAAYAIGDPWLRTEVLRAIAEMQPEM